MIPIRELVLQDVLVFLVEAHLKLVLGNFHKISYCEVDFHNVYVKLHGIGVEIEMILE